LWIALTFSTSLQLHPSNHTRLRSGGLTMLGGLAEFERELILQRTSEGRKRAKAAGVTFGRPPKLTAVQIDEVRLRHRKGESARALARSFDVNHKAILRVLAVKP
jgi:DNA invertase Pin-like site-specific DNA recombinase